MLKNFRLTDLRSLIDSHFSIETSNGDSFTATLSEVSESSASGNDWETFSAIFSLGEQENIILSEADYKIKHDKIGEVLLFGSPNSETELEFCCSFHTQDH